jgi:hypothetical protein
MEEFGIPAKLVRLTKAAFKTVKCKLKVQNDLSESLETHIGLAKGRQFSMLTI